MVIRNAVVNTLQKRYSNNRKVFHAILLIVVNTLQKRYSNNRWIPIQPTAKVVNTLQKRYSNNCQRYPDNVLPCCKYSTKEILQQLVDVNQAIDTSCKYSTKEILQQYPAKNNSTLRVVNTLQKRYSNNGELLNDLDFLSCKYSTKEILQQCDFCYML